MTYFPTASGECYQSICSIDGADCSECHHKLDGPRRVSTQLNGEPEDARSSQESQERQCRQVSIDTYAAVNRCLQLIGSHAPNRMMQKGWCPGRILDQNPNDNRKKQNSGNPNCPDRDWVACTARHERDLVENGETGK